MSLPDNSNKTASLLPGAKKTQTPSGAEASSKTNMWKQWAAIHEDMAPSHASASLSALWCMDFNHTQGGNAPSGRPENDALHATQRDVFRAMRELKRFWMQAQGGWWGGAENDSEADSTEEMHILSWFQPAPLSQKEHLARMADLPSSDIFAVRPFRLPFEGMSLDEEPYGSVIVTATSLVDEMSCRLGPTQPYHWFPDLNDPDGLPAIARAAVDLVAGRDNENLGKDKPTLSGGGFVHYETRAHLEELARCVFRFLLFCRPLESVAPYLGVYGFCEDGASSLASNRPISAVTMKSSEHAVFAPNDKLTALLQANRKASVQWGLSIHPKDPLRPEIVWLPTFLDTLARRIERGGEHPWGILKKAFGWSDDALLPKKEVVGGGHPLIDLAARFGRTILSTMHHSGAEHDGGNKNACAGEASHAHIVSALAWSLDKMQWSTGWASMDSGPTRQTTLGLMETLCAVACKSASELTGSSREEKAEALRRSFLACGFILPFGEDKSLSAQEMMDTWFADLQAIGKFPGEVYRHTLESVDSVFDYQAAPHVDKEGQIMAKAGFLKVAWEQSPPPGVVNGKAVDHGVSDEEAWRPWQRAAVHDKDGLVASFLLEKIRSGQWHVTHLHWVDDFNKKTLQNFRVQVEHAALSTRNGAGEVVEQKVDGRSRGNEADDAGAPTLEKSGASDEASPAMGGDDERKPRRSPRNM